MTATTRAYKDTLFRRLFGDEREKANALSLYNALAGTSHGDPDELELTTVEGVLYMGFKNDVSFLVDSQLVLWEQQSTPNPNMPLRGLIYFGRLYAKHVRRHDLNMHGRRLIELPTPRYCVFYIGVEDAPDAQVLRLSDSFGGETGDVEVTTTVININEGRNEQILEACETLAGYSHFVALVRRYAAEGLGRDDAVDRAVRQCISEGVLADFLSANRAEVVEMFLEEWDEEAYREAMRKEARDDGFEEGRKVAIALAAEQIRLGRLTVADASAITGIPEEMIAAEVGPSLSHTDDAKSLLEEWDEEAYREAMRKEAREDGFEEGRKEGRKDVIAHMVEQVRLGHFSAADAAALTGIPEEEIAAEL